MIRRAEREFDRTGHLPHFSVLQNPATGACRVIRGSAAIEDGMSATAAEISTTRKEGK